jgi:hypothetical protein
VETVKSSENTSESTSKESEKQATASGAHMIEKGNVSSYFMAIVIIKLAMIKMLG